MVGTNSIKQPATVLKSAGNTVKAMRPLNIYKLFFILQNNNNNRI